MREGSLDAPTRHPVAWQDEAFYDEAALDAELRRVFDICHGCRRCFNLCDSFPRLFDLIDAAPNEEVADLTQEQMKSVVDACTLCDMCFLTKCPYVPPHEFNLDFPHLMLRYRAVEHRKGKGSFMDKQLAQTDRNGKLGCGLHGLANWATKRGNGMTRGILERVAGVHRDAALPEYAEKTLVREAKDHVPPVNPKGPGFGRKVVLYATCYGNFNSTQIGLATRAVLHHNGVETEVVHPACCGMPLLEQGDIKAVTENAKIVTEALLPWVDKGYDVIALVPSCALMLKFEWPLLMPEDEKVRKLSKATFDIAEYIMAMAKQVGLAPRLEPLHEGVTIHIACHARAQNIGQKAAELLRLIPETPVHVIERCSGHGGAWGVKKENFEVALKVGRPVAKAAANNAVPFIVSECPLARDHIVQGMERQEQKVETIRSSQHPIEVFALAYGLKAPDWTRPDPGAIGSAGATSDGGNA